jgi:hypothetical protein
VLSRFGRVSILEIWRSSSPTMVRCFVYGTDRGWGARGGKPFALQRLVWTGKDTVRDSRDARKAGRLRVTFTEAVDPATAGDPASYTIKTYTTIYQSSYGSPKVDETKPTIKQITVAPDRRSARLLIDALVPGHVHELHLPACVPRRRSRCCTTRLITR